MREGEDTKSECILMDISPAGAKIFVDADTRVSKTFNLAFVPYSGAKRHCQVVWRRGRMIGLKFVP
jgi:hypothetical protein